MISFNFSQAARERENLESLGVPETLTGLLFSARQRYSDARDSLRGAIADAQHQLSRALGDLDAGYHINRLGILQSSGTKVDLAAAELAIRVENLSIVLNLIHKSTEIEVDFELPTEEVVG